MSNQRRQQRRHRRDKRRERRKIRANPYINRLLRNVVRWILVPVFGVKTVNLDLIHRQKGSFLVVGNHSSVIDPFLIGCLFRRPIHYVAADSQFRSRTISILFGLVGVIPKTKALADLDTVKKIVTVKQTGGVIGLFPEGQNGWDGHSLPIIKASEKLVKSLKVPVIVAQIRGAYFSWPRWARGIRRGEITIFFHKILEPNDLKAMSVDEVGSVLSEHLTFDAFEYQRDAAVPYAGSRRAEYLERALFVCPSCRNVDTLHSEHQRLSCTNCGYSVRMNNRGFFEQRQGPLYFETIRDWNLWQITEYAHYIDRFRPSSQSSTSTDGMHTQSSSMHAPSPQIAAPIISETAIRLEKGYKTQPLEPLGIGPLTLYYDRVVARPDRGGELVFPVAEIAGINVQNNEHLEFYVHETLYRVSPVNPRGNTYKWDAAIRHLKANT